jgi:hypothetical protein
VFQQDLDRLQGWCREKKYDLNARKCKSISFFRESKPVMFLYVIGDSDLERVDVIIDLPILVDNRKIFLNHIESFVVKSARILGSSMTLTRTRRACGRLIKRFIRRELSAFNTTL